MKVLSDISIKSYNSFGLNYRSRSLISIENEDEAQSLFSSSVLTRSSKLVLGSGSNMLFTGNYDGTLIRSEIYGIRIEEEHHDYIIVSAGSGIIWDRLVEWCVNNGYGGLENLSLIPGTTGAAPVQNIGAYGVEAQNTIEKVRALSISGGLPVEFSKEDCSFGYRRSIFKNELRGQFFITKIFFRLTTKPDLNTQYGSLEEEIMKLGDKSLKNVRKAVINIRRSKIPDPEILGNAGSFFKNPVIKADYAEDLKKKYPEIPFYKDHSGGMKVAAGWLIEKCGWKGYRRGDAGVHEKQALVIVNYGNATGSEILNLSTDIQKSVMQEFGISLEMEVEVVQPT